MVGAEEMYLVKPKGVKVEQMVEMMAQAENRKVQRKWLCADELYDEEHRRHPDYEIAEQQD